MSPIDFGEVQVGTSSISARPYQPRSQRFVITSIAAPDLSRWWGETAPCASWSVVHGERALQPGGCSRQQRPTDRARRHLSAGAAGLLGPLRRRRNLVPVVTTTTTPATTCRCRPVSLVIEPAALRSSRSRRVAAPTRSPGAQQRSSTNTVDAVSIAGPTQQTSPSSRAAVRAHRSPPAARAGRARFTPTVPAPGPPAHRHRPGLIRVGGVTAQRCSCRLWSVPASRGAGQVTRSSARVPALDRDRAGVGGGARRVRGHE